MHQPIPISIVYVLRSVSHGGAEQHLIELMQALRDEGFGCIYAGPKGGWLAQTAQDLGFELLPLPMRGTYDVLSLMRLASFVRCRGVSLIHGHLARGALYAGLASRLTQRPCVASVHATTASRHYRWPGHLVAVSNAVTQSLKRQGYAEDKLTTIHLGVRDVKSIRLNKVKRREDGSTPVIFGMAARFLSDKGQDIAIKALAASRGFDWQLKLAGDARGDWGQAMQALVNDLGLTSRVEFLGHCTNMTDFYGNIDVVLAPSRREALSLTLIEAAMHGRPVAASRVGGIPEVVINGKTGFLVSPESVSEFADAVTMLGASAALRVDFGVSARRRYLECFTRDIMVKNTITLYRQLISVVRP